MKLKEYNYVYVILDWHEQLNNRPWISIFKSIVSARDYFLKGNMDTSLAVVDRQYLSILEHNMFVANEFPEMFDSDDWHCGIPDSAIPFIDGDVSFVNNWIRNNIEE